MSVSYKNCTTFIGIDQSLNSSGYYIIENFKDANPSQTVKKGLIKPGNRRGACRLAYIYDRIFDLLTNLYRRDQALVCMEGYAYNYRSGKIFELGEVGGITKMCCFKLNIPCIIVPPTELKKFVTGKGSASKKEMMKVLKEKKDDIADAKGLAIISQEICQRNSKERKKLEVIRNCLNGHRDMLEGKTGKYKKPTNRTAPGVRL